MNIILFSTIIVLVIIFIYQSIKYYKYMEDFSLDFDIEWVDKKKLKENNNLDRNINSISRVSKIRGISRDLNQIEPKYDQMIEFIPDKENYTVMKDGGLLNDIEVPIKLNSVEFKNLVNRVDFYRKLESDKRFSDKSLYAKDKLIINQKKEMAHSSNYPLVRKEISLLKLDRIISTISKI